MKAWIFALFSVALLGITATACGPVPWDSGYPDPNWCRRPAGGGGN